MRKRSAISHFYDELADRVRGYGGMHNAHLHLDRAGTLEDGYIGDGEIRISESSHISLQKKHSLINKLHGGPAYHPEDLARRINACLDDMTDCDTRRADSLVDVTADCVGLSALETMSAIKQQRASDIDLRIGAYSPLGFLDDEPGRWEVFAEGAELADFVAALPEADDTQDYPGHIGFKEHCRRMLEVAARRQCMLHVHTDQRNEPTETGTQRLVEVVRECGALADIDGAPAIWAVHMISPSTYEASRFDELVAGMLETRIGVICCPSAAIGMRQLRPLQTPTYNSIPRILELLAAGVPVRLGSDNIADICSPSTTADLTDEVFVLSAAIRFYHLDILAKLAAGVALTDEDRDLIAGHLEKNRWETERILRGTGQEINS